MKRTLLFFALTALMIFPSQALAKDTYFGLKGVISSVSSESEPHDSTGSHPTVDKSFTQSGFGLVLGKRFQTSSPAVAFRLELENTMRFGSEKLDHNPKGIAMKTEIGFHNSTLINGYLDFPINDVVIPYIGASAGLSLVSYDATAYDSHNKKYEETGVSAAGQFGLGAGLECKMSEKFSLDLGIRYLWSGGHEVQFGDNAFKTELAVDTADFSFGLRYYF